MTYVAVLIGVFSIHVAAMVSPGPNFLVVTQAAISRSRQAGLMSALGVAASALVWASCAILGLSLLFEQFVWLYAGLKLFGGTYLTLIGFKIFQNAHKPIVPDGDLGAPSGSGWSYFRLGFMTNLTNPKSVIFFGSIFAALISPDLPPWVRVAAVGIIAADALWWHALLALAFSTRRAQHMYERAKRWINWTTGTLLVVLGGRLVFNTLSDMLQ